MASTSIAPDLRDETAVRGWVQRFVDAWHSHDPERLASLCTDDVLWEDPFIHPGGVARGKDELRTWLASIFRAMPDLRFDVEGDHVVTITDLNAAGRQLGAVPPAGSRREKAVVVLQRLSARRMRRH